MNEINPESTNPPVVQRERLPILFGPYGLRAGWSLIIAVVLAYVFLLVPMSFLMDLRLIHKQAKEPGPLVVLIIEAASFLLTAVITWVMSKIEGRPVSVYGLGGIRKLPYFLTGTVLGLVAISVLILILIKAGLLVIDSRLLFGSDALRYAVLWIPGFLAIGLFEEYFFRGFLQYTLARGFAGLAPRLSAKLNPKTLGFWAAAILVSFGFGAVHRSNPGESPLGLFCAAFASLIFCFSLWRTGSLWWAVGLHAAWDYGQSFLYGVGDSGAFFSPRLLQTHPVGEPILSGGLTGPEGSVFSLVVLAALACVIQLTLRPGTHSYAALMPSRVVPPPLPDNPDELPATTT